MDSFPLPMEIQIRSLDHLRSVLSENQIDYSNWGGNATKPIEKLWEEIELDETRIRTEEGDIFRVVGVANVFVKYRSAEGELLQLWEERQEFANGSSRPRNNAFLAEKGSSTEDYLEWAARALKEELGLTIPTSRIQTLCNKMKPDENIITSFPGLKSQYHIFEFEVLLTDDEFKEEGYVEEQKNKKTFFVWR